MHFLGKILCIFENKLCILGEILCISEIILRIFFWKFCVLQETFCALLWKYSVHFKKHLVHYQGKIFCIPENIWCNSGSILCIINERFYVFKKTFGAFLKKNSVHFLEKDFVHYRKDCLFQQTFYVFWEMYFAPVAHCKTAIVKCLFISSAIKYPYYLNSLSCSQLLLGIRSKNNEALSAASKVEWVKERNQLQNKSFQKLLHNQFL